MERRFLKDILGPGLLFAGAAVGVSHLVQSTRAGASFGFGLLWVVLLANATKYPAFALANRYTAISGQHLLEGYKSQGKWALWLYLLMTLGTMLTVQAAVTVVTAGLVKVVVWDGDVFTLSAVVLVICGGLLRAGQYRLLDAAIKVMIGILTVSTVVATLLALRHIEWETFSLWIPFGDWDLGMLLFVAGLVGWMPAPLDIGVWQSLWIVEKKTGTGVQPSVRESFLDFQIGYAGTVILAVCFLTMGACLWFGTDRPIPNSAGAFSAAVVGLYVESLGEWARYVIGPCALAVMFSTTLTVLDGFPRALAALSGTLRPESRGASSKVYWGSLVFLAVGALLILRWILSGQMHQFKRLIDVATALAVTTAPVFAWLNHRAVFSLENNGAEKWRRTSVVCISVLILFALFWIVLQFVK